MDRGSISRIFRAMLVGSRGRVTATTAGADTTSPILSEYFPHRGWVVCCDGRHGQRRRMAIQPQKKDHDFPIDLVQRLRKSGKIAELPPSYRFRDLRGLGATCYKFRTVKEKRFKTWRSGYGRDKRE